MANREVIRAFNGKILGSIETDIRGNKIVRDFYGKILGRYNKEQNVTRNFYGKILAKGDQCAMLLSLAKK